MRSVLIGYCIGIIFCLFSSTSFGQSGSASSWFERDDNIPGIVSFFAPFIFPKVIQDGYRLKDYIRSNAFARVRQSYGDLCAVDAMFEKSLRLSWNNVYEALLITFVGTMDHRTFGVKLPIIGDLLWFPLTSEFPDDFRARVHALPTMIYPDTPNDPAGDRDKLQHFFGSAFLTFFSESRGAAERIGGFIEWGEQKFIVNGAFDERDFRANQQGIEFGLGLLDDVLVRPSDYLQFSIAVEPAANPKSCVPGNMPDSLFAVLEER